MVLEKCSIFWGQRGIKLIDSIYTENVELSVLLPLGEVKTVEAEITEGTNGRVKMEEGDECWFAQIDGGAADSGVRAKLLRRCLSAMAVAI